MTPWQYIGAFTIAIPAIWQGFEIERPIPPRYVLGLLLVGTGLLVFGG